MRRRSASQMRRLPLKHGFGIVAFVSALGCAIPGAVAADSDGEHPMDSVLKMLNLKADEGKPLDFVEKTRPGSVDYVPVGKKHPDRVIKPKTAAEVKASEAELDGARIRQQQMAGQPVTPAVAPSKPAAPKKGTSVLRGTQN